MLKEFLKLLAAKTGHKISKQLPFFLNHNESLVQITFEHVLSELITSVGNCQFIQVGANDGSPNDPRRKFILKNYLNEIDRDASLKFLQNLGYSFVMEYFDITAVHKSLIEN